MYKKLVSSIILKNNKFTRQTRDKNLKRAQTLGKKGLLQFCINPTFKKKKNAVQIIEKK